MSAPSPTPCAGVVCFRDGQVLLVRRARPPREGEWSIPGGKIHGGERAIDAALRELHEETGVGAEIITLVDVVDAVFRDEAGELARHYVLIDYAAIWASGEVRPGDDAGEARFFPLEEACALVSWEETRRVIRLAWELVDGPAPESE